MEKVRLGDITNNLDNRRIPLNSNQRALKESEPLYPYIGANNIMGYIDEYIFDEKIICIAEDGGSWGKNEICAKIYNEKVWVNNHAHVLTAKENLHLEYLMYYLNITDLNLFINGATRGKLTQSALNSILIPLPSLSIQKEIAAKLDKADEIRRINQQLIAKYNELTQSLFLDMFGDPVKNEKGWEKVKLGEYCEKIQIGPFGSQLHLSDYIEEGIPLINPTNINENHIDYSQSVKIGLEKYNSLPNYHLKENDIIMSRRGDLSKIGLIKKVKSFCGTGSLYVRFVNLINPRYIVKVLKDKSTVDYLYSNAQGITMPNLNKKIVYNIPIPLPPISLQNQFAERVQAIEAQKELAQEALAKSEALFQSLLQESFKY